MASKTLLEIVQDILNDLDSDEVNSINDTIEAQQVANIVRSTYEEIIASREWPHLSTLLQLTASGDADKPNYMKLPANVHSVDWVKYNKRKSGATKDAYEGVTYLYPDQFMDHCNGRNSSNSDVEEVSDASGVSLLIVNDKAPTYYTSFDDEWLVFDSYDSEVDSTLQTSKTQVQGYREPTFSLTDTHTPDLPAKAFPYLIAEAKSTAFLVLKQAANQKEEQKSRRQRTWLSREKWRTNGGIRFQNDYGRQSKK